LDIAEEEKTQRAIREIREIREIQIMKPSSSGFNNFVLGEETLNVDPEFSCTNTIVHTRTGDYNITACSGSVARTHV
jgi:urate oxidase